MMFSRNAIVALYRIDLHHPKLRKRQRKMKEQKELRKQLKFNLARVKPFNEATVVVKAPPRKNAFTYQGNMCWDVLRGYAPWVSPQIEVGSTREVRVRRGESLYVDRRATIRKRFSLVYSYRFKPLGASYLETAKL